MTRRLTLAGWCLLFSALIASVLWFSREWQYEAGVPLLKYIYPLAIALAVMMSPNVHDPSDLLVWLAITLQTFAMALLAAKIFGVVRRKCVPRP